MVRNSKDTQNQSKDSHRTPRQRTRMCTHADIVRMKIWISANAFENAIVDFKGARIDEPNAKKGGTGVTDINTYKLRYIGSVKSANAANVFYPNFGANREPHDTNASFNYEKFIDHIAFLCCRKDQPSDKEHDGECTKEIVKELFDKKDE